MHPAFLKQQFDQSKANLGLKTIDLMYLHNAYESQALVMQSKEEFFDKLKVRKLWLSIQRAFEFFETKIQSGELQYYGMATWLCFRAKPEEDGIYLNLQKCIGNPRLVCILRGR